MATPLESLQAAYTNLCARIAEVTANPKPDYSIDGKSYSWASYLQMLIQQRGELKRAIQDEEGPWMVQTDFEV